jgi:Cu/Ag efflux protein CusF
VSLAAKPLPVPSREQPAPSRKFVASTQLDSDLSLLAVEPQLSPGVQSIEISARTPGGPRKILLFARDIPLEWPTPYIYAKPVSLPKGTVVSVTEHYANDSSDANGTDRQSVGTGLPVTFIAYQGTSLPVAPVAAVTQPPRTTTTQSPAAPPPSQRFKLSGTVKSIDADNGRIVVQHGDIPGFMSAMTMSYRVAPGEDLKHVAAGDKIESDVVVDTASQYLENIKVTGKTK